MSAAYDDAPRGFVPMREYLRLQRRVEELEDRLATVNEDQEEAVSNEMIFGLRIKFRLSPQCARLLAYGARHHRTLITRDYFKEVIGIGGQEESHVNVIVHKVNKALMAQGSPRVFRGFPGLGCGGWTLEPEAKTWLAEHVPSIFEGQTP